jgi:signal peptidase II
MEKANYLPGKWRNAVFFLTAFLVVTADQISKVLIRANLDVGESLFEVGFFRIIRVPLNTGASFGIFKGHSFTLAIVAIVGIVVLLAYIFFFYRHFPLLDNKLCVVALGLILGGTAGNLIDRLNPSLGGVTDFISIGIWPVFNLADSASVVGAIIFAYTLLPLARGVKK